MRINMLKSIIMGKKKTKQFFKSDEITSVYKHGKFIFAYKENGTTDIYEKKRKSYKLLIASNVKEFYHRNGYLFFLCQDSKTGWSCKKEGDIKALHLGDAIGDFFVLNSHHGYKISFFGIDGSIRSITKCSEYFYNEQKDLLIIKRNGWYQLWEREDYWKTLSDTIMVSSYRYFLLVLVEGFFSFISFGMLTVLNGGLSQISLIMPAG